MLRILTLLICISLVGISHSCKTQSTSKEGKTTGFEIKKEFPTPSPQQMNLYSFEMTPLEFIVSAFQRNVKACPSFDEGEASQYLFSALEKRGIPFVVSAIPSNQESLGLVDENVQALLKENFPKYGIIFFSPESAFPLEREATKDLLIYSKKLGWVRSNILNSKVEGGTYWGEVYTILERNLEVLDGIDPERGKTWGLFFHLSLKVKKY